MGSYAVIAETSELLLTLLRERITARTDAIAVDQEKIVLTSPNDIGDDDDVRLSLYLYGVTKNDVLNTEMKHFDEEDETLTDPPLGLDLQYLLTAYPAGGNGDLTSERVDQQRLLGLAMQTLNDISIVQGDEFGSTVFDRNVSITLQTEKTAEAMDIWWNCVPEQPYHVSIAYTVSPVLVDSRVEEWVPPVDERELEYEDKEEEGARQEQRAPETRPS